MTLRRARIRLSVTSSSWRHTLAVALLALIVSVAPCVADICNTTCAVLHDHAGHAGATSLASTTGAAPRTATATARAATTAPDAAAAAEHCANHDSTSASRSRQRSRARGILASTHACQTHTHPLQTAASAAATTDARPSASSHAVAILPIAAIATVAALAPPPPSSTHVERRLSTQPLRSRPLTVTLRI